MSETDLFDLELAQPEEYEDFSSISFPDLSLGDKFESTKSFCSLSTEPYTAAADGELQEKVEFSTFLDDELDLSVYPFECPNRMVADLKAWCVASALQKGPPYSGVYTHDWTEGGGLASFPEVLVKCLEFANDVIDESFVYDTAYFELTEKDENGCLYSREKHVNKEASFNDEQPSFRFNFGSPLVLDVRAVDHLVKGSIQTILPQDSVAVLCCSQYAKNYQDVVGGQHTCLFEYNLSVVVRAYFV